MKLNVTRLVHDCGGPHAVAKKVGVPRTVPYRWMKSRYLSSRVLERMKAAYPKLKLDRYFEATTPNEPDPTDEQPQPA